MIDHAQPTKGAVRLLVSVPGTDAVDYDKVEVKIDGNTVVAATAAASTTQRGAHLDPGDRHQQQHEGPRIAEAKKAALAYLATRPGQREGRRRHLRRHREDLVAPTLDRAAATQAINGLTLTLHTALYDGVLGAIKAAGPGGADAGQRKILVLSDGKDTTATKLTDVLDAIKGSGVGVDVVSLQQGDAANQPLNAMASAGKGKVLTTADPAALTAAFASEANALARQIVVTAQVPAGFSETSSNVDVTGAHGRRRRSPPRRTSPCAAPPTSRPRRPPLRHPQPVQAGPLAVSRNVVLGGVGAIGVGLLGRRRRPRPRRQQARATNLTLVRADPGVRRDGGPGPGRPASRRRRRHRSGRPGPPGSREGPGQQQEPRGPARHRAGGRRPGPAARRVAAAAARASPSAAASSGC